MENDIEVNGVTKTVLKVTVDRRYKDKNGEWKSSQSFSRCTISPLSEFRHWDPKAQTVS